MKNVSNNNESGSNLMAILMASAAAQPIEMKPRQFVKAEYFGNGLCCITGSKHDLPLHKADAKSIDKGFCGEAMLVPIGKGSDLETDPTIEDGSGLCVSFLAAADWRRIEAAHAAGETLDAELFTTFKRQGGIFAGYRCRIGCVQAVLRSKELRGVDNSHGLTGETIKVKIASIDIAEGRIELNLSHLAEARKEVLEAAQIDELITGTVVKYIDAGALVDIGSGATGLVHKSELVRGDEVKVGGTMDVVVTAKDVERGRISLSQRKGARRAFVRDNAVGAEFDGAVKTVKNYGVFVTIAPGVAGLLHASKIGRGFTEATADSMLPNPLRVTVTKMTDDGERIDLALV